MKSKTVTVNEGEKLGPIDWSYNFRQHFDSMCCSDERRDAACEEKKAALRTIEDALAAGKRVWATFYGDYEHEITDIGMYDGSPHWRQTPAVYALTWAGGEWQFIYSLGRVRIDPSPR